MITRRSVLAGLVSCPVCISLARAESAHWSYEGVSSPEHWGTMEKSFRACAVGTQQSPVNLEGGVKAEASGPVLNWKAVPFSVVNNGHSIELRPHGDAGGADLNGRYYALRQFHFHTPSEHAVDGRRAPMEAHFVHEAEGGALMVLAVFLEPGHDNAAFSTLMGAAPHKPGKADLAAPLDPSALLPQARQLYRYEGSLTTPPCAEVVDWNIYTTPMKVAQGDIDTFKALFPMNARPLQAMNRRFLLRLD